MGRATIADGSIKAVRAVNFLDVLNEEGIPYFKNGREAVTTCPWHNDTNPSLTINPDQNFCFCFVCQIGQDNIGFLKDKLNISFSDAVTRIAEKHNIKLDYENIDPEEAVRIARERAEKREKLNKAQEQFRKALRSQKGEEARTYIDSRGIEPSTSQHFGLGFSVLGAFAGRLTIPIHDHIGNIVGFTGRSISSLLKPKYKNSESSETFDKSQLVFNEHRALRFIRESDSVIFVEGHLDVISLYQAGFKNVVAMQGTAKPSLSVINRLSRLTKRFILCYDNDQGGHKAIGQFIQVAGPLACQGKISVNVARLPEGKDPDDYIKEGQEAFHQVLEAASPWIDWQIEVWVASLDRKDTALFSEIEKKMHDLISKLQSPALRQYYIDKASKALGQDQSSAIQIAKSWGDTGEKKANFWTPLTHAQIKKSAERRLVRAYLHFVCIRDDNRDLMDMIESPVYAWAWARIREIEGITSKELVLEVFCAVVVVSEPHFLKQLRPLIKPTVSLEGQVGIMGHIRKQLTQGKAIIDGQI